MKRRVLFVQPVINPPGGGQCVAAWALQALREDYVVDLMTWLPVDFDAVNRFYGTRLDSAAFDLTFAPAWLRWLVALDPDPYSFQRVALLMRAAKLRRRRYDLILSFTNEMEFQDPSIQYIHYPYTAAIFAEEKRRSALPGWRGKASAWTLRHRPWRLISGYDFGRMRKNLTLVNSDWTGLRMRQAYGVETVTLYPPVPGDFPEVPWGLRENGFVCIGRLAGEKRHDLIIEIVARLRALGYPVHLHLIGGIGSDQADRREYRDRVAGWAREHGDWITLDENVSRAELAQLVSQHRYAIHGMPDEHFGIAVAEAIRGGCIAFVPNGGGQLEIVGAEPGLLYDSPGDATEKISRVLDDTALRSELRSRLRQRSGLFSPELFTERLRNIVRQYLIDLEK